jgi:hypothetical protein
VLHAKARRRKESWAQAQIGPALIAGGNQGCRTPPYLSLLRALGALRGEKSSGREGIEILGKLSICGKF